MLFWLMFSVFNVSMILMTSRLTYLCVEEYAEKSMFCSRCNRGDMELTHGYAVLSFIAGIVWPITLAVLFTGRKTGKQKLKVKKEDFEREKKEFERLTREYGLLRTDE